MLLIIIICKLFINKDNKLTILNKYSLDFYISKIFN